MNHSDIKTKLQLLRSHMHEDIRYKIPSSEFTIHTTEVDIWIKLASNHNENVVWNHILSAANELWEQVRQDRHI